MFNELTLAEEMDIDGGSAAGDAAGYLFGKFTKTVQTVAKEALLAVGEIAATGAAMVSGNPQIMFDYQDYAKKHSVLY